MSLYGYIWMNVSLQTRKIRGASLLARLLARECFALDSMRVLYFVQCVNGLRVTDASVRRFWDDASTDGIMRCFSVLKEIFCNINSKCYGFSLQVYHSVLTAIAQSTDEPFKVR